MFRVVLRPNTEPVDTESDGRKKESDGLINSAAGQNETKWKLL